MRRDHSYRNRFLVSFIALLFLIVLGGSPISFLHLNNETKLTYSQLIDMADRKQISKVAIFGDMAKAYVDKTSDTPDYVIYLTDDQSVLINHLQENGVYIVTVPEQNGTIKYYLAGSIMLILLIVFVGMLCSRVLSSNIRNKVDMYIDTFKEMYQPELQMQAVHAALPESTDAESTLSAEDIKFLDELSNSKVSVDSSDSEDVVPPDDDEINERILDTEGFDDVLEENVNFDAIPDVMDENPLEGAEPDLVVDEPEPPSPIDELTFDDDTPDTFNSPKKSSKKSNKKKKGKNTTSSNNSDNDDFAAGLDTYLQLVKEQEKKGKSPAISQDDEVDEDIY